MDKNVDTSLRPQTLEDYIGQDHTKELIRVALKASKVRGETLDHILLTGPSGVGKTTLAFIIANELGKEAHILNAAGIDSLDDVSRIITSMNEGDILFIDEIHRLPIKVEEFLYHPMEDSAIEVEEEVVYLNERQQYALDIIGEQYKESMYFYLMRESILKNAKREKVSALKRIPPITIIGATTRAGALTKPLRDRFNLSVQLRQYTEDELDLITKQKADMLDVAITDEASRSIAKRSRGTARIVVNYVRRCRDVSDVRGYPLITPEIVDYTLTMLGVDKIGLTNTDLEYLSILARDGKPRGVRAISSSINEDVATIEEVIEPYLIQIGFIERSTRGRVITREGQEYINVKKRGV